MRRDLTKWAANGSETIGKNQIYDLSHTEVIEAMMRCETGDYLTFAFNCLIHGLYIGVEIGQRIERNRQRAKAK